MSKTFSYNRKQKLKSEKEIDAVFASGKSIVSFPLKLLYLEKENAENPLQAGIAVSSRFFKKAVHRNRIKRLIREAHRLQKNSLITHLKEQGKSMAIFWIYIDKELPQQQPLVAAVEKAITKLIKQIA